MPAIHQPRKAAARKGAATKLPGAIPPQQVIAELEKHILVDGFKLVFDLEKSRGSRFVDAATGRVLRLWSVGVAPYGVVLAKGKAYVSNWGGRTPDSNSITGPAGRGTFVRVDAVRHVAANRHGGAGQA